MSGPTTVIFSAEPVTALLAAAGIRAAMAVRQSHQHAASLSAEHAVARESRQASQRAAHGQGMATLIEAAAAAEARFAQLTALADKLGTAAQVQATRPARPPAGDADTLAGYIRGMERLVNELQAILLSEAGRQRQDLANLDQLEGISLPQEAAEANTQSVSQQLLARIVHLGELPADIATLAHELDDASSRERAELLATELRRAVQAQIESAQKNEVRQATALIVEHSLKELGYQVEDVAETLFVEGGTVHFRRPGWGDYMVRLRVDAKASSANFNVIRATDAGSNERSVLDHVAEDRWCAEFPALLKSLEVQGVRLDVTRRLAAGELPVQLVDRARLPPFVDEESGRTVARPITREIK